ncbi:MAG: hypothetical protein UT90_C0014G0020 [Parcubacteria group bacterium GW2011_GWA1_40_21]|nr:MAG: hypothetical protein UT80_C0013G0018 [Parcubacteria group bacterium GW2011_GWC1_40_13]KKR53135.1 MAG: hypothetical protein UT90_C0014G0020 [Parcubacteria group bacterium GW2011_GWA1_40_21]
MTKMIKNKIMSIEYSERKAFWYLALLAAAFSGFYIYFVNGAIINVVERQKTEKEIISVNSRISDLESSYFSLNGKINLDYAYSLGFVKAGKEKYVYRKSLSANLSLNHVR